LIYCGVENFIESARMEDDIFNHIGAGAGSGLIYKSTAGPRTAVVAAGLGAIAAGSIRLSQEYGLDEYFPF